MTSIKPQMTIKDYQNFIKTIYGKPNDIHFDLFDLISNIDRFAMRGVKGIRKGDKKKAMDNLLISFSWFVSALNRLHIDLDNAVWKRFPNLCPYCAKRPCECKKTKGALLVKEAGHEKGKPKTLHGYQDMFNAIYPPSKRTLEHAAIHLAEELAEFSESLLAYRGEHLDQYFGNVILEASDVFSNFMDVFNSMDTKISQELARMFHNNCHICHKAPCQCRFSEILNFKS